MIDNGRGNKGSSFEEIMNWSEYLAMGATLRRESLE